MSALQPSLDLLSGGDVTQLMLGLGITHLFQLSALQPSLDLLSGGDVTQLMLPFDESEPEVEITNYLVSAIDSFISKVTFTNLFYVCIDIYYIYGYFETDIFL